MIRFKGFFSQYIQGHRLTNFSFYHWQPAKQDQQPRAAFVLVAEVTGIDEDRDGNGVLKLHLIREGKNGYPDVTEDLEVYTFDYSLVKDFQEGTIWRVKGFLQQGEGEDEFGMASGPIKPFILKAEEVGR